MKINYDFYKDELNYNNLITPEVEKNIIENYILKNKKENYKYIIEGDLSTETHYALSQDRENIINWYPFKKGCKILEICSGLGEITGYLCGIANKVVAIETSKNRAEAIAHRHEEKTNLEIYAGNIEDIKLNEKFDYVVLIGNFEYASKLLKKSKKPYSDLLNIAKSYLKKDGTILLAANNALGVENICGNKSELYNNVFESLYDLREDNEVKLFTKKELEKIIQLNGFKKIKFYYPLPNYKLPNVIYSENKLPTKNATKILYSSIYNENSVVISNEQLILNKLITNNLFEYFSNSFFIEISDYSISKIDFVSFNNIRNEEYKLKLIMDSQMVIKEPISFISEKHIENIKNNIKTLKKYNMNILDNIQNSKITSKYVSYLKLDDLLMDYISNNKMEKFYDTLDLWYNELKNKILISKNKSDNENDIFKYLNIEISKDKKEKLNFIKDGYIDLVFENAFIDKNKIIFFDQEWYLENIPFELIIYRAINNFYIFNPQVQNKIDKISMLKRFNIDEYQEEFEKVEKSFQEKIIDSKKMKFYTNMNRHRRDIVKLL